MRESVKTMIERAKKSSAVVHWETSRSAAMKKRSPEEDEKVKKELDEARRAMKKAEEMALAAERRKDEALEELARAESEAEELGRERADMEGRVERSKAKAERAKTIAAAAENRRMSAEAMMAEAENARMAAMNDAEASRHARMMADQKLAESLQMMDKIRADLIGSEKSRAADARLAQVALEKARSQIITSSVLDVVPSRDSRGFLTHLDVQIGTDRFRVVPVRNAAGLIVEMRREEI